MVSLEFQNLRLIFISIPNREGAVTQVLKVFIPSMHRNMKVLFVLISIGVGTNLYGTENLDSLFLEARKTATELNNRELAIQMCEHALNLNPDYHDFRVLMGRCKSWDGKYEEAEIDFKQVLDMDSSYVDARNALLDTYIWSERYGDALSFVLESILLYPANPVYIQKQSLIQEKIKLAHESAMAAEEKPVEVSVASEPLISPTALDQIDSKRSTTLRYNYDRLADTRTEWQFLVNDPGLDPWHFIAVEHMERMKYGPVIFKFNYASRYTLSATQIEIESYPLIRKGTYLYTGIGISNSDLFPLFRMGLEVFQALPRAFEASLGLRYLKVPNKEIPIYVASLGKYWESYWFNVKTYISPSNSSFSKSWVLSTRRYFYNSVDYVEIFASSGVSPDTDIGGKEVDYLNQRGFGFNTKFQLMKEVDASFGVQFSNLEVRPDAYRGDTGLQLSITKRY